jgi:putative two-component system response regulator
MSEPTNSRQPSSLTGCRILIIDDEPANVRMLECVLSEGGYRNYRAITDPRQTLQVLDEFKPDLILLDLLMPYVDGFLVLKQIARQAAPDSYLPILVLTADVTRKTKQKALSAGAHDFLTKPFDITEALLRIRNLLETRLLHLQLAHQNTVLEQKVKERTRDLEEAQYEMLERLSIAAEYRDDETDEHAKRVGLMSERLAIALGVSAERAAVIRRAAALHDIGKIGIPDAILLKPGKLTPEEMQIMRTHTVIGSRILSGSLSALLQTAEVIASTHHERWDGKGYWRGLAGEAIPLEGRIVTVADAFDAMTHDRPYRRALSLDTALNELCRNSGKQFDPTVVAALVGEDLSDLLNLSGATAGALMRTEALRSLKPALQG